MFVWCNFSRLNSHHIFTLEQALASSGERRLDVCTYENTKNKVDILGFSLMWVWIKGYVSCSRTQRNWMWSGLDLDLEPPVLYSAVTGTYLITLTAPMEYSIGQCTGNLSWITTWSLSTISKPVSLSLKQKEENWHPTLHFIEKQFDVFHVVIHNI
jgi:hypothetical protein